MKKIYALLILVLLVQALEAQDYFTVIKVSGNIVIERTGTPLDIGTSFSQDENLLFKVPDSRAAVINPQKGRFIITSQNIAEFKSLKSNYLPSAGKISTRSVGFSSRRDDLRKQIEGNYVILDESRIKVDTDFFPLTDKNYFYITYDFNDKIINRKLAFNEDTILIRKNELLAIDGIVIPDPRIQIMKLVYLEEGQENSSEIICSFLPVFPDLAQLKLEIKVILEQMEMSPYEEKLREISAFIKEFYGNLDEPNLKRWLSENFNLIP